MAEDKFSAFRAVQLAGEEETLVSSAAEEETAKRDKKQGELSGNYVGHFGERTTDSVIKRHLN